METAPPLQSVSERVTRLKSKYLHTKPTVCTERAEIYTEVYKANEAKPLIVRRALALDQTLRQMTITIADSELIELASSADVSTTTFEVVVVCY